MAKMFGCSHFIAHRHMRRFQQAGKSTDAKDRRDVKKQRQDRTVNLHSRIDVSGSSTTHLNVSYQTIKTRIGTNDF